MATIQEATQSAMAFALASLGAERTQGLRLEEIESDLVGGDEVWRITLSMLDAGDESNTLASALSVLSSRREYKTFAVRKDTGEVTSMKIREISKA